jgi:hypothetical protein
VIYPGGKCRDFQSGGQHAQVEKCKDFFFQNGEKYKDFSRCSCCNVRPNQVKNAMIFQK